MINELHWLMKYNGFEPNTDILPTFFFVPHFLKYQFSIKRFDVTCSTVVRSSDVISVMKTAEITKVVASTIMTQTTPHSALSPITVATAAAQCLAVTLTTTTATTKMSTLPSPKKGKKHEDGWKEVVRRYEEQLLSKPEKYGLCIVVKLTPFVG